MSNEYKSFNIFTTPLTSFDVEIIEGYVRDKYEDERRANKKIKVFGLKIRVFGFREDPFHPFFFFRVKV